MTKRKRRTHSPEFKARVALEALKGIKPIHEIASGNGIHPVQVSKWKKELQESMAEIFERKNSAKDGAKEDEKKIERLERKVGQLVIERDWLAKKVQGVGDRRKRKQLIDHGHLQLSLRVQSNLLGGESKSTAACAVQALC